MSGYETESLWKDELWRDTLNGRSMEKGCVFVVDLGRHKPRSTQTRTTREGARPKIRTSIEDRD